MNARIELAAQPPCLLSGVPAGVYHAIHAMSAGGLKRMAQSPAHFYGMQLDPERPALGAPTEALVRGTLFHSMLFEPETVAEHYRVKPDGMSFATKDGKAWREANDAPGVSIVDAALMTKCAAMAAAVRRLPDVAALLAAGTAEDSAFWIDEQTGELCKCRPDWTSPAGDGVILVDGKSCGDASPEGFGRQVWNMRYDLQAAWYSDGYQRATGKRVHAFVFAAVEADWPHAAAAYVLGDDVLDRARGTYRELLDRYAECRRTGIWPGYQTEIQPLSLPRWAA